MIKYQLTGRPPSVLKRTVFSRLTRACRGVPHLPKRGAWTIGVSFVTPKRIEMLNRAYRGKKRPTDVLSFAVNRGVGGQRSKVRPFGRLRAGCPSSVEGDRSKFYVQASDRELGDIVICTQVAVREAKRRSIDPAEELIRLLAHGTLHLGGLDHATPKEEERMFRLQEAIVEKVTE